MITAPNSRHRNLLILPMNGTSVTSRAVPLTLCQMVCNLLAVSTRSSRKRPPRKFKKVVITRAGRLQDYALVSDPMVKQ